MNPVIFDFDGTLANSGPIIIECFDLTLKEEQGKEYPPEFRPFIGPPLGETFGFLGAEDPDPLHHHLPAALLPTHVRLRCSTA